MHALTHLCLSRCEAKVKLNDGQTLLSSSSSSLSFFIVRKAPMDSTQKEEIFTVQFLIYSNSYIFAAKSFVANKALLSILSLRHCHCAPFTSVLVMNLFLSTTLQHVQNRPSVIHLLSHLLFGKISLINLK